MKIYIRQIRPYFEPLKLDLYGRIVEGYDKWYPEEAEKNLEKEIRIPDGYVLVFEERYIEPLSCRCNKCVYETHCLGKIQILTKLVTIIKGTHQMEVIMDE